MIFRKILNKIKKLFVKLYQLCARAVPENKKLILFESSLFRGYTGNPRYIYEEIIRRNLDEKYKCAWVFRKHLLKDIKISGDPTIVSYKSIKFFYYMASAAFIVSDSRLPRYLVQNKDVTYIQTWHGTPLKKLALDMTSLDMAGNTNIERYHDNFRLSASRWKYLLSQNPFSTKTFKRCFAFEGEILEYGYPRNDVLVNSTNEDILAIKERLGLPRDKKIILYAPTWRDNQFHKRGEYKFASALDFDMLRDFISDEYVVIVKYHYLIKDNVDWGRYKAFVYQFGEGEDIASLYLVSDMLITDYSSVMFDYSVLLRPMIFFAYDLEDYQEGLRGFYFDFLDEAPGPVVKDTKSLIDTILNYDSNKWQEKYDAFNKKYNPFDDGKASSRVVSLIDDIYSSKR